MQTENVTEITHSHRATNFRDWWESTYRGDYQRISDWIELEEGEHYYIEGRHLQGSGGDHFSTAVEIEQTDIVGHHHSMKEVQYLSVEPA